VKVLSIVLASLGGLFLVFLIGMFLLWGYIMTEQALSILKASGL
jgi:hypothetical protein